MYDKVGPVFRELCQDESPKIIILQGGQWSGKTYGTIQKNFFDCYRYPDTVCTVVGRDVPFLKRGAVRDALHIYRETPELKKAITTYNITDRVFNFRNGSLLEFTAYEDEHDARGAKRHRLFINEADRMDWLIAWQLISRTDVQTIIDYNPTAPFWAHEKLMGLPGTKLIISDHRHNPFITERKHAEIEAIRDPELWRVYSRGLTGNLRGTIFPHWQRIDTFPNDLVEVIYGIDYGYTNDPTALVKVGYKPGQIFLDELSYAPGLSPQQILETLVGAGWDGEILYSEHDVEMAAALRRLGIPVILAHKGEGSIKAGILKMRQFDVFYTNRSENLHKERAGYRWQYVGETPTNTPEKTPDHCIDAARYAIYTHQFE
jgi:phage terminase large subunit